MNTGFAGHNDDTAARAVRDEVRQPVMADIQLLRDKRDERSKDPIVISPSACSAALVWAQTT